MIAPSPDRSQGPTLPGVGADLAIIGGGRMGEALLRGMLGSGREAGQVLVVEVAETRRRALTEAFPGLRVVAEPGQAAASGGMPSDAVVAVKPADVGAAGAASAEAGVSRLLSIAAGISTAGLEVHCGPGVAVLRAMPNTPALIGAAATVLCAGTSAGPADLDWAESLLSAVGTVVRLPEHLLDAVTGLSGSGPGYVFLMAEALIDAGVSAGLPRDASVALSVQTLLGAARLLSESGQTAEALRAMVTSPGGTTAAGLRVLEARAVRSAVIDAVAAAAERSRQLG